MNQSLFPNPYSPNLPRQGLIYMNRYICIHGHFYQPPRENPWLEAVEAQESAYPYHDWNERITVQCYAPNTASRVLDNRGRIIDIVNNYSLISFDFGPTLLAWMEKRKPEVYRAIIEADWESQRRFSGHGSALAQAYNHIIMPLANSRDKRTQIIWGIRDFESRFGRMPEGMWLPETAVDSETLDLLVEHGIHFTILAPRQAQRVRPLGGKNWESVEVGRVDPKMPYRCNLPSGRSIDIFFYDGPPSQEIAFSNLLDNGEWLAQRLLDTFSPTSDYSQLVNIATDGETYGHHRSHGDMALASCLRYIQNRDEADLSIYGEYLEKHPPTYEVEIVEDSSWSCAHGVERWRGNCGCNSGMHSGWTQAWRQPLREAMDWLRDSLIPVFEEGMKELRADPWQSRNEYIRVILDRSPRNVDGFIRRRTGRELSPPDRIKLFQLLEMERMAMLIYTSCGWFFDEISGLETVQVLKYAARALQLVGELGGGDREETFIKMLARAPSNLKDFNNGARIYRELALPGRVDLMKIGAQYGISSLCEDYPDEVKLYGCTVHKGSYERIKAGPRTLAVGTVRLHSEITQEEKEIDFAVFYPGDNTLIGGVRESPEESRQLDFGLPFKDAFRQSDLSAMIRLMDDNFPDRVYGLDQLLTDERRKMVRRFLEDTISEVEGSLRKLTEHHYPIIRALREVGLPIPPALVATVECTINANLRVALKAEKLNLSHLKEAVHEAEKWRFTSDNGLLSRIATERLNNLMDRLVRSPEDTARLTRIESFLKILAPIRLNIVFWHSQNRYIAIGRQLLAEMMRRKKSGDQGAARWINHFHKLGELFWVNIFFPG